MTNRLDRSEQSARQVAAESVDDGPDVRQISVFDGEADVGAIVIHHVLNDVIHHDVGSGNVAEDFSRDTGPVRHGFDGDAGEVLFQSRARYDDVFHIRGLRNDPGAGVLILRIADVNPHIVFLGKFHRPRLQHRSAKPGQLEHFIIADLLDLPRVLHNARVRGVDPVHIGVIFTLICFQHRAQGDERRIASASAQRGEITGRRDPLKTRDNDNFAGVELLKQPVLVDRLNAGLAESAVGYQPDLPAGVADGLMPLRRLPSPSVRW